VNKFENDYRKYMVKEGLALHSLPTQEIDRVEVIE